MQANVSINLVIYNYGNYEGFLQHYRTVVWTLFLSRDTYIFIIPFKGHKKRIYLKKKKWACYTPICLVKHGNNCPIKWRRKLIYFLRRVMVAVSDDFATRLSWQAKSKLFRGSSRSAKTTLVYSAAHLRDYFPQLFKIIMNPYIISTANCFNT